MSFSLAVLFALITSCTFFTERSSKDVRQGSGDGKVSSETETAIEPTPDRSEDARPREENPQELVYETAASGFSWSGLEGERLTLVVKSDKDVPTQLRESLKDTIDFSKAVLVGVVTQASSSGYDVRIQKVVSNPGGDLEVFWGVKRPDPGNMVLMVIQQPFHFIKLDLPEGGIGQVAFKEQAWSE